MGVILCSKQEEKYAAWSSSLEQLSGTEGTKWKY